ncbi:RtcB family protein [Candidatus Oscillochloris fontis]|uniref:RtcB family protein n=1 Tax=Candidatus Oscillochloris fontis TaxID=2496868 RepID=UPI00101C9A74|nr:RtcB family protein [Candidatus Oscillochloris fontis]
MKPHQIIAAWKGDKRFTQIASRAAALKKAGQSVAAIQAAITHEFGTPATRLRLQPTPARYTVFGTIGKTNLPGSEADIEPGAIEQLQLALRLPIADQGALMPDAHPGYALPIGGVFRAHRAVCPAMVGVDIACRMMLSIFALEPEEFVRQRAAFFSILKSVTTFGAGAERSYSADHAVLDDPRWGNTSQLRGLRARAAAQLGTSGSGNHFAELVVGERLQDLIPGAPAYFAGLLTHSGSRGVGYAVANHYMRVAAQETKQIADVPRFYEWLDLEREAGQEYWNAMELCGAYASANHHVIHNLFARRARLRVVAQVENHHNFAWREGDMVIHRKGATPAAAGVLGIIPGSMASPSYVVVGTGNPESLNSTSHGAGRRGSRSWAKQTINIGAVRRMLAEQDVLVEGLSADESPLAYKEIERVIQIQEQAGLLERVARMRPIAVLMAGDSGED